MSSVRKNASRYVQGGAMRIQESSLHRAQGSTAHATQSSAPASIHSVETTDAGIKIEGNFVLTDMLTPEIIKSSGVEGAILLMMDRRLQLADSTLDTMLNQLRETQSRQTEKTQERIQTMREGLKEMEKAKKSGKISDMFGWVGLAAAGAATILTAGVASPAFVLASVGIMGVTTAMQIDNATGSNVLKAIAGDNAKTQLGVSIAISAGLLIASMGIASLAASGGLARTASVGGKTWLERLRFSKDNAKLFNDGDHWMQRSAAAVNAGVAVSGSVTSLRGAHANFKASEFSASAMEIKAIQKRLTTHQQFFGMVIEDLLSQIQSGNKTLAKQLDTAFDPKQAIISNI